VATNLEGLVSAESKAVSQTTSLGLSQPSEWPILDTLQKINS
jgi:hypothetical protein